jgi:hypothetical protein
VGDDPGDLSPKRRRPSWPVCHPKAKARPNNAARTTSPASRTDDRADFEVRKLEHRCAKKNLSHLLDFEKTQHLKIPKNLNKLFLKQVYNPFGFVI